MLLVEHDKSIIMIIKIERQREREISDDNEKRTTSHNSRLLNIASLAFQNHDNRLFFMTSNDKTRDASTASSPSTTPKYSTTDRNCKTIPIAPAHRLDLEDIFADPTDVNDKPNLEILKQHLLLEGRLTERAALRIIETGKMRCLHTSQLKCSSFEMKSIID